ncbi:MAG TPA: hypothetical protein DCQ93_05615 [Bacteroidetes bacterium]|nr:hypothetical protein [Bacteroidota bacterium]
MPNTFTPNADQKNDEIGPINICEYDLFPYSYKIFNRWGQLVFETRDIHQYWNGTMNGIDCSMGVYVYEINYHDPVLAKNFLLKGNITLVR